MTATNSERALTPSDPLELLLRESVRLPSFPDVILRLDRELRKEDVDLPRIASLIGMDPVLSGQLLRLANSAWYGNGGPPTQDLTRAIIRLGLPATRDLVHALVLPSLFPKGSGSLDLEHYWKHSFCVALFAQAIGRRLSYSRESLEVLWTAGLLHDIGAVLYDTVAPEQFGKLMRVANAQPAREGAEFRAPFAQLEREWLGADHSTIGAAFLEKSWNLPERVVTCVRQHESPLAGLSDEGILPLVLPLHIADAICESRQISWLPASMQTETDLSWAWGQLGISTLDIPAISDEVGDALQLAERLLGASS